MKQPPFYWYKAKKILSKRDPILRKIINKFNKGYLTSRKDPFLTALFFPLTNKLVDASLLSRQSNRFF